MINKTKTIPKGWKKYILKDSVQFLRGSGLSKDKIVEGGKNKCVLYGELYTKYNEIIKEVQSRTNSIEGTKSRKGDVLLPSSTTTKGIDLANAVAINEDNILLGGDIIIIRDENNIFNNNYFAHYLTHERKKDIERLTQGTTIIHLYSSGLKNLEITLPSIQEQNKIAEILSKVDEDIEKTDQIIKKTEKLKKGLMQELLTKGIGHEKFKKTELGEIPEKWETLKGEEISQIITKGASPRWQGFEYQNDGMFFVTSENVRDGYIDLSVKKFLPIEFHNKLKNSQLKNGDILINIVGASIGRSCVYSSNYNDANINQAVCLLRVKKNYLSDYIIQYLQMDKVIERLLGSRGGSARPNLSLADIKNFKFVIPPKKEQKQIAEILSSVDNKTDINKQIKNKLTKLKKGLMQDLLSGRVRVNL